MTLYDYHAESHPEEISAFSIGIDKKSKSISFFCCSLYTDELGVFMQKMFVRPVQSVSVNPKSGMNILLGVRSEPKTH